jgi:C4-dicarboxylate transporter DctM subunit
VAIRAPFAGAADVLTLSLFLGFFGLAMVGVPLMYSLLGATVGVIVIAGLSHPLETIFLSFIGGVEPFILIAVPLFIFAGEILSSGGVGKRIVDFARALFGFLPGGLGVVTVVACLMFGGVSGSAIADTAAIGSLVIPAMVRRGYSRAFAAALLSVAGTLALLMPLSIPFLVYAFISGVSMRQLSMAGIVPAILAALALIAVCMWHGKRTGCDSGDAKVSARAIWIATRAAGPALLMPVIIVGGIWSGVFTPTESAAVAVVYGVLVSLTLYKDITVRDLPRLLVNAFQTSATVMLVIGATGALAWLITVEQVAVQLATWIKLVASEPWMFLLLVNVALLILGIFIEPLPALLLTAPLLLPIAQSFHLDLVHLGVVMTANLAIALYTPPVGGTLFVAARLAGAGIGEITKALMPLLIAAIAALFVITYVPSLTYVVARLLL